MKKKQIIWRRSISIFLALLLPLSLLPQAHSANTITSARTSAITFFILVPPISYYVAETVSISRTDVFQ